MIVESYTRSQEEVKVVNIGGPLDNFITPRSQRPDFRHVDLSPGPNTIVANVNEVRLETIFRGHVRLLRASNVPFIEVPTGAFVEPNAFVRQAQSLQVKRIIITTGYLSEFLNNQCPKQIRFLSTNGELFINEYFITARR